MKLRFELFVNELETSIQFYENILGFQRGYVNNEYAEVHRGSVEIGLCLMDKLTENHPLKTNTVEERKGLGVEIVLEVDGINEFYQRILETNYPLSAPLQMQPWQSLDFRLVDPDGYYIRMTGE
jgi:lactoylglutathione lyase